MGNYLIKKRYIFIFLLLISNQFFSKGYTLNNKKLYKGESNRNNIISKYDKSFDNKFLAIHL